MATPEVDAYGKENILAMFKLRGCDNFAVFTGSGDKYRLKFASGGGIDTFTENITSIDPFSDATYQVRFYKKEFDEDDINLGTPYNGSFNFKIREKQQGIATGGSGGGSWNGLSVGDARYMAFLELDRNQWKEKAERAGRRGGRAGTAGGSI